MKSYAVVTSIIDGQQKFIVSMENYKSALVDGAIVKFTAGKCGEYARVNAVINYAGTDVEEFLFAYLGEQIYEVEEVYRNAV